MLYRLSAMEVTSFRQISDTEVKKVRMELIDLMFSNVTCNPPWQSGHNTDLMSNVHNIDLE